MSADAYESRTAVGGTRLESLHASFYPQVLAYCLRRVQAADAHEIAAEVFSVAWRRIDEVPAGDQALPWLYGVARNVLRHKHRRARRDVALVLRLGSRLPPNEPGPELVLVRSVEHEMVQQAARGLSAADQEILRLHLWEDLSHAEVGQVLAIETEAARQRFHRATRRLHRHFDRLYGPEVSPTTAPEEAPHE